MLTITSRKCKEKIGHLVHLQWVGNEQQTLSTNEPKMSSTIIFISICGGRYGRDDETREASVLLSLDMQTL